MTSSRGARSRPALFCRIAGSTETRRRSWTRPRLRRPNGVQSGCASGDRGGAFAAPSAAPDADPGGSCVCAHVPSRGGTGVASLQSMWNTDYSENSNPGLFATRRAVSGSRASSASSIGSAARARAEAVVVHATGGLLGEIRNWCVGRQLRLTHSLSGGAWFIAAHCRDPLFYRVSMRLQLIRIRLCQINRAGTTDGQHITRKRFVASDTPAASSPALTAGNRGERNWRRCALRRGCDVRS
ncbi:hypothetical protein MTO96_016527 [Rhipicephalus appendiculatus]